ncbi:DUF202 domain-containing protein [Nocardia arthritidis]|nr:DUF202 domain-containing protein [Nocardia arthritidis]
MSERRADTGLEGLAVERTALAWRRTAVSAMAVAALFLQHTVSVGWHRAQLATLGSAATMVAVAVLCSLRNRSLHEGRYGHGAFVIGVAAAAVVAVAVVAVLLGFTDPAP